MPTPGKQSISVVLFLTIWSVMPSSLTQHRHEPAHCFLAGTCVCLSSVTLLPRELLRSWPSMRELSHRSASPDKKSFHKKQWMLTRVPLLLFRAHIRVKPCPSVGWGRAPCPSRQPGRQRHTITAEEGKEMGKGCSLRATFASETLAEAMTVLWMLPSVICDSLKPHEGLGASEVL